MDNGYTMNYNGKPSTFPWHRLPRELQLNILSFLACRQGHTNRVESPSEKSTVKPYVGHVAKCATICRDWQEYFENILFRKVTVHQKDLAGLHKISRCRTERIQHLWLRIELPPYCCRMCPGANNSLISEKSGLILDKALCNVLRVLRHWKARNSSHPSGGLTLEISTHSPSDSQHEFRNISFDDDEDGDEGPDVCTIDDPKHGWVGGRRVRQPDKMAVYDLFDSWEAYDPQIEKVEWSAPVVKHLLLRRQTRRHILHTTLAHLLKRLPGLESLKLEFWRKYGEVEFAWDLGM